MCLRAITLAVALVACIAPLAISLLSGLAGTGNSAVAIGDDRLAERTSTPPIVMSA